MGQVTPSSGSQSFCSSRVHLFPAACSAFVQKAGSRTDGLTPQSAFLPCRVSTEHSVCTEEINEVPVSARVLLDGPMSHIPGDSAQGPAGAQAGSAAHGPRARQGRSCSGSCQNSHACLQCRLPGHCCSFAPSAHTSHCHEVFSALQPFLPAVGHVQCHSPAQQGSRLGGRGDRASRL